MVAVGGSRYGPGLIDRNYVQRSPRRRGRGRMGILAASVSLTIIAILVLSFVSSLPAKNHTARNLAVDTLPLAVSYQHRDTVMNCGPCNAALLPAGPHASTDAKGLDGVYGTPDDCPHCSAYCAPASISMIAIYRGIGPPTNQQDNIYDAGKSMNGETTGNLNIETHGVGMFHGVGGAPEVQLAMTVTLGGPLVQHNQSDATALTAGQMTTYIHNSHPILWLDHGGWPANESSAYPPTSYRLDQGHAKVIGGYDDSGTVDTKDDLCLIFDPWPEYTDRGILPPNTTQGPGGTFDPYWQPLNDVNLSDPADVYLVDTYADTIVPEFSSVLLPAFGLAAIAIVAVRTRRREEI